MVIIPPHLVVVGLKFAAARLAHKGVEKGLDMASREYARRVTPEGEDLEKAEKRARNAVSVTRQAVRISRQLRQPQR